MATYLLLRDNKESGPFSVDDLLNVGLKPYDLVWVQGKSAAWRYPSEVEELKPYAPVVEEQPFDRFYKKPGEEKKEEPVLIKEQVKYAPSPKEEESKFVPKKSVFVTLPGQKTAAIERPVQPKPVIKESPVSASITISERPEPVEIKYSQPLDDIKEMYVKTLQQRKNKTARKSYLMANLKKAGVVAGLICVGAVTGFMIKSKPGKPDSISQQPVQSTPVLAGNIANLKTEDPSLQKKQLVADPTPAENQNEELISSKNLNRSLKEPEEFKPATIRIRKETMIKPAEKKEFDTNQTAPSAQVDPITGERIRTLRTGNNSIEEKPMEKSHKNSLNDLVSVASNDYKRVAFGGIRNLQLTVTNNSKYELDNVVVELQYLKPSEEPLRTENIKFKGVAANGTSTIRIPDTNRGIKISYKIINIESKQNSDAVANR
ncbi:MAG: hypothetical protein ABI675_05635 [Chitinophagaceae bacterium]